MKKRTDVSLVSSILADARINKTGRGDYALHIIRIKLEKWPIIFKERTEDKGLALVEPTSGEHG